MARLSSAFVDGLRARGVAVPNYALRDVAVGVVHFGPGAFHRVHQAFYFDRMLERDRRFGICGVSLQSSGVRDALASQDNLYTLAILDREPSMRIVGACRQFLVAQESPRAVLEQLADPRIRLITATITEKGYCLTADGALDTSRPEIQHDLRLPSAPVSFIGYLVEGLRLRRDNHLQPPTIVSCDNLTDNGARLRCATIEFARLRDATLADWIENEATFPRTMVDSITPATDDVLRARVAREIGYEDAWPVQREAFTQWVIEEHDRSAMPDWEDVGVTITNDVGGYERAKLRLLNGAHSSLAYIGSLASIELVSEAMCEPSLATFIRKLMFEDIAPTIRAPRAMDVDTYIESLLRRFQNPALPHRLAQIAWDGSQKIPFRLLGTIADALTTERSIDRLCLPIAAWFHFIRRKSRGCELAIDPHARQLFEIGQRCSGIPSDDVAQFLSLAQVFPETLRGSRDFGRALERAYAELEALHTPGDLNRVLR